MTEDNSLRRAAVAQHADTLSVEVHVVSPAGRMKHLALERFGSLQVREARYGQCADGSHEDCRVRELLLARTHVAGLDAPHVRICVPLGLFDRSMEPAVGTQSIFVDHATHIFQNFWLRTVGVTPVRFWVGGEGIEVNGNIRGTTLERRIRHEARQ
jgi:hypothetical protein